MPGHVIVSALLRGRGAVRCGKMRVVNDKVMVIGSGVTGLTTAVLLAEAGCQVVVRTEQLPLATTSAVAGALLGPIIDDEDPRVNGWLTVGDATFRRLADDPATGVRIARGRLVSKWAGGIPPWASHTPGFAECTGEDKPAGYGTAFWVQLPIADMRRYLSYLETRLAAAGGRVEVGSVQSLDAAASEASIVMNCTGVYAGRLTDDHDLHPMRGQHVIVRNPGLSDFLYEGGSPGSSWAGYFPHRDRVVLCGIASPDVWDRTPDPAVTAEIIERNVAIEPRLAGMEVLGVEVGLRPARSRVRIEAETVSGSRVVHHYGHAGNGVQWSWGAAQEAVDLALQRTAHPVS